MENNYNPGLLKLNSNPTLIGIVIPANERYPKDISKSKLEIIKEPDGKMYFYRTDNDEVAKELNSNTFDEFIAEIEKLNK